VLARLLRVLIRTAILVGAVAAVREVMLRRNERRFGTEHTPYP
jgi:hypothetical protein